VRILIAAPITHNMTHDELAKANHATNLQVTHPVLTFARKWILGLRTTRLLAMAGQRVHLRWLCNYTSDRNMRNKQQNRADESNNRSWDDTRLGVCMSVLWRGLRGKRKRLAFLGCKSDATNQMHFTEALYNPPEQSLFSRQLHSAVSIHQLK
jgi:hypothetical protein